MATLYVQKRGENGRYATLLSTQNVQLARFIAKRLNGRTISQTSLVKSDGIDGFRRAVEESLSGALTDKEIEKLKEEFKISKNEGTKDFLIKLPVSYHNLIKAASEQTSKTMSSFVVEAIKERLKKLNMIEY